MKRTEASGLASERGRSDASDRLPWLGAIVMIGAAAMDLIDLSVVNVALPTIRGDLGASSTQLQWVVSAYMLAFAAVLIVAGSFGDLWGRKRMFCGGVAMFGVTSLVAGLAPSAEILIAARWGQGLAAGVMIPQVLGTIRAAFPAAERGKVFGIYGGVLAFSSAFGLILDQWSARPDRAKRRLRRSGRPGDTQRILVKGRRIDLSRNRCSRRNARSRSSAAYICLACSTVGGGAAIGPGKPPRAGRLLVGRVFPDELVEHLFHPDLQRRGVAFGVTDKAERPSDRDPDRAGKTDGRAGSRDLAEMCRGRHAGGRDNRGVKRIVDVVYDGSSCSARWDRPMCSRPRGCAVARRAPPTWLLGERYTTLTP